MNLFFSIGGSRCVSDWVICVFEGRLLGVGVDGIVF